MCVHVCRVRVRVSRKNKTCEGCTTQQHSGAILVSHFIIVVSLAPDGGAASAILLCIIVWQLVGVVHVPGI